MKLSQFRRLIKEEVKKVVKEAVNIPAQLSGPEFAQAVTDILPDLKKQIDIAAQAVKVTYVEDDNVTRQFSAGRSLKVNYVGIKESNKLANAYNEILVALNLLTKYGADSNKEQQVRAELAKFK